MTSPWDSIKAKTEAGVRKAAQNASRQVQMTGLRRKLAKIEQDRAAILTELGRTVYEAYRTSNLATDNDSVLTEFWPRLQELDAETESLNQHLQQLADGEMSLSCPSCQREAHPTDKYCAQCGTALVIVGAEATAETEVEAEE